MKTRIFSLFAAFALLFSVSAVARTNGDADAPTYYYWYGIQDGTVANPSSPINASNYTTLAESSTTLKDSMTIAAEKGYAYVLVPNTVTEVKWFDLNMNMYSSMKFDVIDTSIPGHLVYKSEGPFYGGNVRLDFTYGEVDNNYYYYYGIQDGTLANPSSPINASNYTTLAESSSTLKESMTINTKKGWMYILVPNTVTEIKLFDLNANAYSTVHFNAVDTSIPGHVVYKSESVASSGNGRLDFTYGEVDNNYYYWYGIQDGTLANPSSPINASNYTTLAESSSTLKESMTINTKKGWMYILVPNTVTEIKVFDLNANAYSTVKFNVIDTSIPGHFVYKSGAVASSGSGRLDFTYGEYIVVTGITLDRTSVELTEGETTTLVATVAPDDATVKMVAWSTSDEAIATVDNGVVTAVAAGTATITAKAGDKEATCVVTVEKKAEEVGNNYYYWYGIQDGTLANPSSPINASNYTTLAESSSELKESLTIDAQKGYAYVLVPNTVTEVKLFIPAYQGYSSVSFNVVDTSIPGHVVYKSASAVGSGEGRLDFTYGEYIVVTGITLDRTNVELAEGETTTLVATVAPDDATVKMVAWSTSDAAVATVDNGVVTAVAAGTATITAKAGDKEATCVVTVEKKAEEVGNNYYYWYGIQDGTLANPSSPINASNYTTLAESSSTLKESMTINTKKGWMYILVPNTVTEIKFFDTTLQAYSSVSFNVVDTSIPGHLVYKSGSAASSGGGRLDFTYGEYIVVIDRTSVELTEGETTTLVATVAPADATDKTVTWSTSDATVATVENGVVTAVSEGTATITAKAGEKSATCKVTVSKKVIAVSGITLSQTTAALTEGETVTLTATVTPADATDKTVTWSTSDAAVATVENGVVTAKSAGTATITAKAGDKEATCVVTVEKKEEPLPVVADGEYYLYNVEEKQFLSRGEYWGTCATVDRYGIPFAWSAQEGSIKFLDSEAHLFETDDSNIYTDNNSTGFAFEEVEGGYLLKSQKSDRYLTIVDAAFTHQIVNVTDDASAAAVWQLKSKAEHDAIVAAYVEENYTSVIGAAGITATAGAFVDYLATLNAVDMTSAIGTARFEGSVGSWTYNEVRGQENQPAYGTDFCELWQATGNHAQTITGLAEGIYKVTVQGFERSGSWATCNTLAEKGYEIATATLSANGEETNLKSWYSGKSDESNPNNTDEAVAKFADGLYQNEVYTYVGKDGTLTLTLCKPGHVGDNWVLFNNFTLTRYTGSVAVTGITLSQAVATLTEGESLTLTATVAPDNATDKAVTWSSSNAAVATVDNNGVVTAVAEGSATITAKAGDKSAVCVVTVEKKAEEIVYAEIANGDYYLKNVGSGKFLTGANDWGTQASLGEYGLSITLERLPNGKYTLDTHVANNETDHYLGSNGYIDASVVEWIITEPKSGTYALTLDGISYWGYDGSGTVLANALTDPTQKNAQWQLVTRAELENALGKATLNNGVDATFYIQGHSFNRNHNENAAWMGEPVLGGPAHDMNAEKFNTAPLDIYQELSGMPNGYYVVEVQGFYRDNVDPNVTAERRAAGTEQLRASLYAGVYSVPLKSILDGATAEQLNAGIQTSYGWVPNSMDETASYFAQGFYINKVDAWVTDGTLRIGIRKETGEEGDWVIFDNFRLTYYGTKAPAGIDPSTINSQPSTIYDLTGRKVTDTENLKGGIYIMNGKKVVIK